MSKIKRNLSLISLRSINRSHGSLDPFLKMKEGSSTPKLRPICHSKRSSPLHSPTRPSKTLTETFTKHRPALSFTRGPLTSKPKKPSIFKFKTKTSGIFNSAKPPLSKLSTQLISLAPSVQHKVPQTAKPSSILQGRKSYGGFFQRVSQVKLRPLVRKRQSSQNEHQISFGYHEGRQNLLV